MGDKTQPSAQAGQTSKAAGVAGEVGVPHSSVDLHYFKRCKEPRGDTYSTHGSEAKDAEMAGATRIITPDKVRELQIVLYRKAKAQPKYRFWSLYGELLRQDVLNAALEVQIRNGGVPGVDGETLESIKTNPEKCQQWVERLREELRTKGYRPSPVRRGVISKKSRGGGPVGGTAAHNHRVANTAVIALQLH